MRGREECSPGVAPDRGTWEFLSRARQKKFLHGKHSGRAKTCAKGVRRAGARSSRCSSEAVLWSQVFRAVDRKKRGQGWKTTTADEITSTGIFESLPVVVVSTVRLKCKRTNELFSWAADPFWVRVIVKR